MLLFSIRSVLLDNVVIVMGSLKVSLHFGELVLDSIKLHTSFLASLLDFP